MKSHLLIPVAMLGICTLSAPLKAQITTSAALKAPSSVTIDGHVDDWKDVPPVVDSKNKLSYTIANDADNLYIVISTMDKGVKHKIANAGLVVSINTEGKKKKTYTVTYPLAETSKMGRVGVSGFKGIDDDDLPGENSYGLKVSYKFEEDHVMNYEMAIPLKLIAIKPDKSNDLFINVKINGVDDQGNSRGSGNTRTEDVSVTKDKKPHAARGNDGSGGSKGHSSDDEDLSESQDFWLKLTLAK